MLHSEFSTQKENKVQGILSGRIVNSGTCKIYPLAVRKTQLSRTTGTISSLVVPERRGLTVSGVMLWALVQKRVYLLVLFSLLLSPAELSSSLFCSVVFPSLFMDLGNGLRRVKYYVYDM